MDNSVDSEGNSLPVSALTQIDKLCVVFETSWRAGHPTPIESLLNDTPHSLRNTLLSELLLLDVEYRSRRGEQPQAADYAGRFPDDEVTIVSVFARLRSQPSAKITPRDMPTTDAQCPAACSPSPVTGITPGDSLQHYTILQELGHGGFGTVYLARDEKLRREVAVKVPRVDRFKSDEEKEYFLDEASTAANLNHKSIVPIHYAGQNESGVPFVVMEYLTGDSLETTLRLRQLTFEQIAELIAELADAVHYAHLHGVVHRDLKPSNIVFNVNGKACITDFGLAEHWEPVSAGQPGNEVEIAGTSHYIPPEVYLGTASMGPGIDVYALGVILYQALTGRYPYEGETLQHLQEKVLAGAATLPKELNPNVPERLQRICLKAIEPVGHRYESAQMLADELRRFLEGREVLARPIRYDIDLRGRLQNHYAAVHLWREQNLISTAEMDRILRPYWFLLQSDSPWPTLARRYPLESIAIRLGGWLVLLSTFLWPWLYWGPLPSWAKIASVAFPTVALNAVGWTLRFVGSQGTARIFLATGALLLPLLIVVMLEESALPRFSQGDAWELFASRDGDLAPSNMQFTIAITVFLANCIFLLRLFPGKMFAIWLGVGIYAFFAGYFALCGVKEWLLLHHVARALICFFVPCNLMFVGALAWDRFNHRGEAAMLYVFFPVIFVVLMTLLGYYGSEEWLHADLGSADSWTNETVNQWWMCNSLAYAVIAVFSQRAKAGFVRYWSTFFTVLVPLSLMLPCNLLFDKGLPIGELGGNAVTLYQLLFGLTAVSVLVLGTAANRITLSLPGLIGLAVFVFRFTHAHFLHERVWPLCIALVGGVAMLSGVAVLLVRARRSEPVSGSPVLWRSRQSN